MAHSDTDSGAAIPYHTRLLSTSGEYYARSAFSAYHKNKSHLQNYLMLFTTVPRNIFLKFRVKSPQKFDLQKIHIYSII